MSSTYSRYLTVRPDDYLGGASQNASTTLSGLTSLFEAFAAMIPAGTTTVAFQEQVPGAQFAHILKLESENTNDEEMQLVWHRFFCHAVISKLPPEALLEVEDRLTEIYKDYIPRSAASQFVVTSTFQPRVFMAQQGRRYSRPEIDLED